MVHNGILLGKNIGSVHLNEKSTELTFEQTERLLLLETERERILLGRDKLLASNVSRREFDVVSNLRLVPKFDEGDPNKFFSLFERIANTRNWPDSERVVMLQSVFTGKAQAAYSTRSERDSKSYRIVKEAVLKAYELVPEAYRHRFRSWTKAENQSMLSLPEI